MIRSRAKIKELTDLFTIIEHLCILCILLYIYSLMFGDHHLIFCHSFNHFFMVLTQCVMTFITPNAETANNHFIPNPSFS